jgi:hypothetical protein
MNDIITRDQQSAIRLLEELWCQLGSFHALVGDRLTKAQNAVNESGAQDHEELKLIDDSADAIYHYRAPFYKRMERLTKLIAAAEGIEFERSDHA